MNTIPEQNFLTAEKGLKSWLTTLDHKRIGILYLISITFFFFVGGLFALMIRLELMFPQDEFFMKLDDFNQVFTLHGVIMIFLVIIPSVPAVLGNFVLPLQLGAKDVAFPRLNLASWYLYMFGASFALFSIFTGGVDTGWTFYAPYSTTIDRSVISMTMAVFIIGFSSIFTGLNFIVTIHKLRAPGMTWFRMPLFAWSIYATGILQVVATPVIGITVVLLVLERVLGIGIFDPTMGGDPVLFQHFFWFYSHPAVYIMILPGMGIISETITAMAHKNIFGYKAIAYSSLGIAFTSFLVWGHHMFVSGQSEFAAMVFSFLTFFVAIPSAIKVFNWIATLYKGSISLDTPMLYTFSFLILFTIGGLTGLFLGTLSVDVTLSDTYFVVAHFHYVMMGGSIIAFLAGLHYWWPKIWGRMYNEKLAKIACGMVFVGFNVTFISQFLLGLKGMPRRNATFTSEFAQLNGFSSWGAFLLGAGLLLTAIYLIHAVYKGKPAGNNPWGALTLEWTTSSPPPHNNFEKSPTAHYGPYDFDKIVVESTLDDND